MAGHGGFNPPWTEAELIYLRENYATSTVREIAAQVGKSENAVRLRASKEGLASRHHAGTLSLVPGYFKVIDTPVKAYLLGLLTADGWISDANQLGLAMRDYDSSAVEFLRDNLAPAGRLVSYRTKEGNTMVKFQVQNADLAADLAGHGIVPRKTRVITWPALPPELEGSYICGCFDGDGSLHPKWIYRWSLVSGSVEFLKSAQSCILARIGVKVGGPYTDKRHQTAWSIVATGEPVRALDEWIHRDVPGLARKRLPETGQESLFDRNDVQ